MRIMLSAGEASGDLHGSHLAQALAELSPGSRLSGMGGERMAAAGVRILYDPTAHSPIGFTEALKSVQVLRRILARLGEVMERQRPDVLVVIDFPTFNLRLAEIAHVKGIPVVYYFSPAVWAWGKGRAARVARTAAAVCSVFPFEADAYRQAGANVTFVGHPLVDIVRCALDAESARKSVGLDPDRPVLALLPGSRRQEIRSLLPVMAKAARQLQREVPGLQVAVPVAPTVSEQGVKEALATVGIEAVVAPGRVHEALRSADAAAVASGTATLEAALLGTPEVVIYRVSTPTYLLARTLVKIPHVALPNIVAGRLVVQELLQTDATAEKLAAALSPLLRDPAAREAMRRDLADVVSRLGEPGAVDRTARIVLEIAAKGGRA